MIVLDPKGDAAEAAVSLVPASRTCTLLDLAHPTCGFNPLAVDAPADVIADYVVAALKNLFADADIRASSDRYLRNAMIAVLAYDRRVDAVGRGAAAVGRRGGLRVSQRASAARVRTLPEFKEISEFFTAELAAQLADARSMTTAKLDAPVNKLARLLNSPSIKRVLLNDSLRVDFDRVIAGAEVLVVKGALGVMGAGNTSVLMQLLVGMLDAALARQQDLVPAERARGGGAEGRRGAARAQPGLRRDDGAEALGGPGDGRVLADRRAVDRPRGARPARRAVRPPRLLRDGLGRATRARPSLTMAEFSDTVRARASSTCRRSGAPTCACTCPSHHAIASWSTPAGRQAAFVAETIPLRVDRERIALHAARQAERGGSHRTDLRQPHWDRERHRGGDGRPPAEARSDSTRTTAPQSGGPSLSRPSALR